MLSTKPIQGMDIRIFVYGGEGARRARGEEIIAKPNGVLENR